MKIKTAKLIGPALDWAVAKCEGGEEFAFDGITWGFRLNGKLKVLASGTWAESMRFSPSTDWAQGGPIIERECIGLESWNEDDPWRADIGGEFEQFGPTPLIAAMRCYVASKLGYKVDVPEGLA